MAYTTPPTFVASDVLPAADLNILSDDIIYLKGITDGVTFSGTKVNRGSNQSISNATATDISFTAEIFDFGGWWSSGTTVTVPAGAIPAGYTTIVLEVVGKAFYTSNATGYRRLAVLKNGASFAQTTAGSNATDSTDVNLTDFVEVEAGDDITMQVTQTSGGALNVTANLIVVRFAPGA